MSETVSMPTIALVKIDKDAVKPGDILYRMNWKEDARAVLIGQFREFVEGWGISVYNPALHGCDLIIDIDWSEAHVLEVSHVQGG